MLSLISNVRRRLSKIARCFGRSFSHEYPAVQPIILGGSSSSKDGQHLWSSTGDRSNDIASFEETSLTDAVIAISQKVGCPVASTPDPVSRLEIGFTAAEKVHLDIGGCSYHVNSRSKAVTGFTHSININDAFATPYPAPDTYPIPYLVKLKDGDSWPSISAADGRVVNPFPFEDGFFDYITLQNAPLTDANVKEIARLLRPGGEVGLWIDRVEWRSQIDDLARSLNSAAEFNAKDEFSGRAGFPKIRIPYFNAFAFAHIGTPSTENVYVSTSENGSNWPGAYPISGWIARGSLTVASFKGKLFLAHIGRESSQNVYISYSPNANGSSWTATKRLPFTSFSCLSLAAFGDQLFLAYIGTSSTDNVRISSTSDGVNWSAPIAISGWTAINTLSLAAFGPKLYLVHRGRDTTGNVYISSSFDGVSWIQPQRMASWTVTDSLSVAALNHRLYIAHIGRESSQNVYVSSFDGIGWDTPINVPGWTAKTTLALSAFKNQLYLAHKGTPSKGNVYFGTSSDGKRWSQATNLAWTTTAALCLSPYGHN